jgi:hypothetical protein
MAVRESLQRFLLMSDPDILPLRAQAARGQIRAPERSQFAHLLRHFLERFFNHETASPDGDAKARLVTTALAVGLPGFVVALYLWPVYHNFIRFRQDHPTYSVPPPYWLQVNHHFFFVVYSFVALGIVAVFEWDMFFPDLLDILILKPLPIPERTTFLARVLAIALLLGGFLFDANFLAPLALPSAIDPPNLPRFLAGHLLAVAGSGLFAATFVLAFECIVLSALGEWWFRKLSLFLQGLAVAAFLMVLLLFPVYSGVVPDLLRSGAWYVRYFPPFWFLGIYQRMMEGPSAQPVFAQLAFTGCVATLVAIAIVVLTYPLAYLRRTRELIEGGSSRSPRNRPAQLLARLVNGVFVRSPQQRAIFHYVSQTLFRVPRYRIYLVLYGGVGLSIVIASVLRFSVVHHHVRAMVSAGGLRASIGIVTFWAIAGLRVAFLSPGNQQGSWIFYFIHGRPPEIPALLKQLQAAKLWGLLFVTVLTAGACLIAFAVAPSELLTVRAAGAQLLVSAGLCLLLTDLLFLHVTTIAFTGESTCESPNLAMAIAKYFTILPVVILASVFSGPWIERHAWLYFAAPIAVLIAHGLIALRHREIVRQHCLLFDLVDRDNLFLLRLDLRKYDTRPQHVEPSATKDEARRRREA